MICDKKILTNFRLYEILVRLLHLLSLTHTFSEEVLNE